MKNYQLFSILMFSIFFVSCKTEKEFDGPSLNDLYGKFTVVEPLSASNYNVDFSAGQTTFFSAAFSKNVAWNLQIKGIQSGAIKKLSGFSNVIDASNAEWNGTITTLPLFKIEFCAIELTFENEPDTLRDTVVIAGNRINEGFLLSDFEDGVNPGWTSFVQSGANMSFAVRTSDSAAQGTKIFDIGGAVDWDYLIAYLDMPATAYGNPTFPLSSNAESVYFNAMLFKPENLNNGIMLFQFREDENGDGAFNAATEDMYSIEVAMTENGWKQLSVKYNDLQSLVNGQPAAPNGNGIHEPNKLWKVSTLFLANPTSGYAHAYLDYYIFTEGGPLVP